MQVLIGADPELFLQDRDGKFVSAHNLVPGSKREPHKVHKGAVQLDGTAFEFNIDPASSAKEFLSNIKTVTEQMREMVPGYNIVCEPVATFDDDYFMWEIPGYAKELGCDPDYDAYTMEPNPRPDQQVTFRTGSGHVHIGWTNGMDPMDPKHFELCGAMARQMDYYLGVYSLLWDPDPTRRQLYGKAGAFRPKPYGMEYRTLSNRWLQSDELIGFVFNNAKLGATRLLKGFKVEEIWGTTARRFINNNVTDWPTRHRLLNLKVPHV